MKKQIKFQLPYNKDLATYIYEQYGGEAEYKILQKSLDARGAPRGKPPVYHYTIELGSYQASVERLPQINTAIRPIIIGAGPGGLFAALRFAEYGVQTIILERGDRAQDRMKAISKYWRKGILDEDNNVCYGEGGAGLFSDGKLITRIKSPFVQYVMDLFVRFGAPEETAYLTNPHLGSNKIRQIISKITDHLKEKGHEVRYNSRVTKLIYEDNKVVGVELSCGEKIHSSHVILATGHSAKEMYSHLHENKVKLQPKGFAVGCRVEHPRIEIDKIQHGKFFESDHLGAAKYKLNFYNKETEKGTYSFCMCPGGYVLSSGTDANGIVVNGMSNYARNSRWSNSALVVSVEATENLFGGLELQESIEQKAFELSKKLADGRALPAMSVKDFLQGKLGDEPLPKTSSPSGIFKADITNIFPTSITEHLKQALNEFDKKMPGFCSESGVLIAPETRTSAPITIVRDKKSLISTSHKGLYPCAEGAGYAGGITSAAVDGIKIAESIIKDLLT